MNKTLLIIKREYVSRVRKKSFLVLTLLTPILFSALIFIPVWLAESDSETQKNFLIADDTGKYAGVFQDTLNYRFFYINNMDWQQYNSNKYDIFAFIVISNDLLINPEAIAVFAKEHLSYGDKIIVKNRLEQFLKKEKLASFNIPDLEEIIRESEINLHINTINISDSDSPIQPKSNDFTFLISIMGALFIYMFVFMYGAQVMHSVLEEKNNRIVEILISSVKPSQLLTGKIAATMLVAFTQFACWVLLTAIVTSFIALFFSNHASFQEIAQTAATTAPAFDFGIIRLFGWYLIYFLVGYLLYSSLFATIGSVIESGSDSQQFMLPVTIPLLFALYVAIYCIQHPESDLVFWCSMIPFTSPIVMVARLPFHVPVWQLVLSVSILIATFIIATKMAAKVYKTGILMYGKKIKYKDIWRWLIVGTNRVRPQ